MAVSVRMDPLLEKELAQAAKRRGITKSQFIVEAVERALGRNNPGEIYLKVMQEMATYNLGGPATASAAPVQRASQKQALQEKLRARHAQENADYAAFLITRQAPTTGGAA
ncbi:MAG: ribbon-helix-helix protein, CopG family [Rhodoferax sp.]|nr:ribbon-helix-helix protein, CopG family [Rhodoferax sp.]